MQHFEKTSNKLLAPAQGAARRRLSAGAAPAARAVLHAAPQARNSQSARLPSGPPGLMLFHQCLTSIKPLGNKCAWRFITVVESNACLTRRNLAAQLQAGAGAVCIEQSSAVHTFIVPSAFPPHAPCLYTASHTRHSAFTSPARCAQCRASAAAAVQRPRDATQPSLQHPAAASSSHVLRSMQPGRGRGQGGRVQRARGQRSPLSGQVRQRAALWRDIRLHQCVEGLRGLHSGAGA